MKTEDLNYYLPPELIAQEPTSERTQSKLMVLKRSDKSIQDETFENIASYLKAGDCLVLNNTKVIPARFYARRISGAKLEGLYLDIIGERRQVMLKNSRKLKGGEEIILLDKNGKDFCSGSAEPCEDGKWQLKVNGNPENILSQIGFAPLPPYIKRNRDTEVDRTDIERYQTVFANRPGAVAAPTAGLHFSEQLLEKIKLLGVEIAYVTLHVGAGTFKPVTAENLNDHKIHSERYSIDSANAEIINQTKQNGSRIIAVGTTSVRTLETAGNNGKVQESSGDTKLFITPGYEFKIVDAMITNFHLPKSTLLALVGAFAGLDYIKSAYQHAIENKYRFYSYGDAMVIF